MISEIADLRALSRAVIAQAVRDLANKKNPVRALGALLWMSDPQSDFSLYKEVMDAPFLDPYLMLSSGGAKKLRGKA
jgi:hypothetical protein